MPEDNTQDLSTTETVAAQGDTVVSDVVEGADTGEATLLDNAADLKPNEAPQTEESKSDLLGDINKPEGEETAPEEYEPFTTSDGKQMDESDLKELNAIAKEHNLSQESAQKAALVASDLIGKMVQEQEAHTAKVIQENADAWAKQDPTGELKLLAQTAVKSLGDEMHQHLKENGYLQDAKFMSILAAHGKAISEGKSISGKPATQQSLLYPNTPELYP